MNDINRRRHPRHETEMRVELSSEKESFTAIMIDITQCSIGVISEKRIDSGTEVQLLLKYIEEYTIRGTVMWMEQIQEVPNQLYRMGIEADSVIVLEEVADAGFPERSEYIKSLLSEKRPVDRVLVVDDEKQIRNLFKEALIKFGYQVTVAADGDEALKLLRANPVDLIITDIFMPKKNGHALIRDITREFPNVKIFAITGNISFNPSMTLDVAKTLGAVQVFRKPIEIRTLIDAIEELAA
jgi:CheY-like chemotaxis protein